MQAAQRPAVENQVTTQDDQTGGASAADGARRSDERVQGVKNIPPPTTKGQIETFLGFEERVFVALCVLAVLDFAILRLFELLCAIERC